MLHYILGIVVGFTGGLGIGLAYCEYKALIEKRKKRKLEQERKAKHG